LNTIDLHVSFGIDEALSTLFKTPMAAPALQQITIGVIYTPPYAYPPAACVVKDLLLARPDVSCTLCTSMYI
jgi:hypothetical protein